MRNNVDFEEQKVTVLIVGAGPVGLLTALRLGQAGISTLVLESHTTVLPITRAMVYMPVTIPVLIDLGMWERVAKEGFLNHQGISWRDIDGKDLATLPLASDTNEEFGGVILLGQARMAYQILEELKKYSCVEILFGLRCVGIEDLSEFPSVKVMAHQPNLADEDIIFEADYVLGADGTNSSVRRMMCIPFEGFTYNQWKLIGLDIIYDFVQENGFNTLNFIVDPNDWAVIAYSGEDADGMSRGSGQPLWRIAYGEPPEFSDSREEILERAEKRVRTYLKGSKDFKIARAEPYYMHQRCAALARKGRVLLLGDALHSNNPMGGLGLTGGILDAYAYGNALTRVIKGGESDSLLTDCADSRRQAWLNTTNALSKANFQRMSGFDEETTKSRQVFFHRLKTDESFPRTIQKGFDKMMPESFH